MCELPMSPASPSMSAWVQHSVSPNASVSYDAPGIKPELGGVSLTAVCASSNSLSGSSPGDWPHHALPASQLGPESCIRSAPDAGSCSRVRCQHPGFGAGNRFNLELGTRDSLGLWQSAEL